MSSRYDDEEVSASMEGVATSVSGSKSSALHSEAQALASTKSDDQKIALRSHDKQSWDLHRDTITRLYLEQNKPLKEVMHIMEQEHAWVASAKQYKSKLFDWSLEKNIKTSEMLHMIRIGRNRAEHGKKTRFRIRGQVVDPLKIERWAMKHSNSAESTEQVEYDADIEFDTPPVSDSESVPRSHETLPSELLTPHSPRRSHFEFASVDGTPETHWVKKRKRSKFDPQKRMEAAMVRSIGACQECRMKKIRCHHALEEARAKKLDSDLAGQSMITPKYPQILNVLAGRSIYRSDTLPSWTHSFRAPSHATGQSLETGSDTYPLRDQITGSSHRDSVLPNLPSTSALLLCWEDEQSMSPISKLAAVLEKELDISCRMFKIPFAKCTTKLHSAILEFCSLSKPGGLQIVYYTGLGQRVMDNQFILSSRSNPSIQTSWTSCQRLLEEGDSNVLLLFESPVTLNSGPSSIVLECLAASAFTSPSPPNHEFTESLCAELVDFARTEQLLDIKTLYVRLLRRLSRNGPQTTTPVHVTLNAPNSSKSILLSPKSSNKPDHRSMLQMPSNSNWQSIDLLRSGLPTRMY